MQRIICAIGIFLAVASLDAQEIDDLKNILSTQVSDVDDFLNSENGFEIGFFGLF